MASGGHRLLAGARLSVRFRLTATAAVLAAVTFFVAGAVLLLLYDHTLNVDQQKNVRDTAVAVAAQLPELPQQIVRPPGFTATLQILDGDNRVIFGDQPGSPIMVLPPGQTEREEGIVDPTFRPDHRIYLVARRVTTTAGSRTVVVADTMDRVDGKFNVALCEALVLGALLLPAVVALSWFLVGRTLRPVEQLRSQVAVITKGHDLSRRVPQSNGRDEISRLATTLNEMLQALHESAGAQRRFVADAAHELRTPLAGMTAYLEVAASHPDLIEPTSLIPRLLSANQHLNTLVDDLLTLAVLDAGAQIKYRPLDLAGVVQDGVRHVDPAQIRVEERIAGPAAVIGNSSHLTRVVTNLVSNAVRHARSAVVVSLGVTATHAVLTVVDDGPGIPPGHRERIWKRFVRLDDDRNRATGGTGLGLALVKEIITAHRGAVRVGDAASGQGAAFAVRLPLLSANRPASRVVRRRPTADGPARTPWPSRRPAGSAL